jgi:hypothetical protein
LAGLPPGDIPRPTLATGLATKVNLPLFCQINSRKPLVPSHRFTVRRVTYPALVTSPASARRPPVRLSFDVIVRVSSFDVCPTSVRRPTSVLRPSVVRRLHDVSQSSVLFWPLFLPVPVRRAIPTCFLLASVSSASRLAQSLAGGPVGFGERQVVVWCPGNVHTTCLAVVAVRLVTCPILLGSRARQAPTLEYPALPTGNWRVLGIEVGLHNLIHQLEVWFTDPGLS